MKMKVIDKLKNRNGFMSVEALFGLTAILMVIILAIGFFTYMIPRQQLEQEVNILARTAKLNGGLTDTQVNNFKKNLESYGYKEDELKDSVSIRLTDLSGETITSTVLNVEDPLDISHSRNEPETEEPRYIKRSEDIIMEVRVEVPAKKQGLMGVFGFFDIGEDEDPLSDNYVFKERVVSERN